MRRPSLERLVRFSLVSEHSLSCRAHGIGRIRFLDDCSDPASKWVDPRIEQVDSPGTELEHRSGQRQGADQDCAGLIEVAHSVEQHCSVELPQIGEEEGTDGRVPACLIAPGSSLLREWRIGRGVSKIPKGLLERDCTEEDLRDLGRACSGVLRDRHGLIVRRHVTSTRSAIARCVCSANRRRLDQASWSGCTSPETRTLGRLRSGDSWPLRCGCGSRLW